MKDKNKVIVINRSKKATSTLVLGILGLFVFPFISFLVALAIYFLFLPVLIGSFYIIFSFMSGNSYTILLLGSSLVWAASDFIKAPVLPVAIFYIVRIILNGCALSAAKKSQGAVNKSDQKKRKIGKVFASIGLPLSIVGLILTLVGGLLLELTSITAFIIFTCCGGPLMIYFLILFFAAGMMVSAPK